MDPDYNLIPPWTILPNSLMDYVIPLLRESEEKVLLYVLRRTYGFKGADNKPKEQDYISFSQFLGGRVSHEGKLLDFGCGIGRAKLVEALAFLQAIDLVERVDAAAGKHHAGRGAIGQYRLNLYTGIVQKVNQLLQDPETAREKMVQYLNQKRRIVQKVNHKESKPNDDATPEINGSESEPLKNGSESEPGMVQKVNLQKKEKETKLKDLSPTPLKKGKGRKKRQDAIPVSDYYEPRPQDIATVEANSPTLDWRAETEKWLDWDKVHGPRWKDHDAAWRLWMKSANKRFDACRLSQAKAGRRLEVVL